MALGNVNIDTITSDVWNNFRTLLNTNVTSVSVTGLGTVEVKAWVNSNTEKTLNAKSNYPIIVINSPTLSFENITYTKSEVTGRIEVEVMAGQAITADKFLDLIMKTVRDDEATFRGYGIEEIIIDDTASTFYERGNVMVHSRKVVWRFKYLG